MIWSYLDEEKTSRAAEFMTDWIAQLHVVTVGLTDRAVLILRNLLKNWT